VAGRGRVSFCLKHSKRNMPKAARCDSWDALNLVPGDTVSEAPFFGRARFSWFQSPMRLSLLTFRVSSALALGCQAQPTRSADPLLLQVAKLNELIEGLAAADQIIPFPTDCAVGKFPQAACLVGREHFARPLRGSFIGILGPCTFGVFCFLDKRSLALPGAAHMSVTACCSMERA
jgi:hypothetical protein